MALRESMNGLFEMLEKGLTASFSARKRTAPLVEYALYDAKKPIGVATYEITRTLPRELRGQLSYPEEIAALLEGLEE